MTLVVDASAVVVALVDEGPEGEWARGVMEREALAVPGSIHVEVSSALRRAVLGGRIGRDVAALAHEELVDMRLLVFAFDALAARVWALHSNVPPYDAAYVALAEGLAVPLLTLDRKLARADGPTCEFLLPPE
jgi:predicted nucleic acid-binding protein